MTNYAFDDFVRAVGQQSRHLRRGQLAFDTLQRLNPKLAAVISGTKWDPYYDDEVAPRFFQFVEKFWNGDIADTLIELSNKVEILELDNEVLKQAADTLERRLQEQRQLAAEADATWRVKIDQYLDDNEYRSVEDWARDSDYIKVGDMWLNEHGDFVNIVECLWHAIEAAEGARSTGR